MRRWLSLRIGRLGFGLVKLANLIRVGPSASWDMAEDPPEPT